MAPSRPRSSMLALAMRQVASPGPPSPTFSEATNVSAMNFGADGPEKIITRANLKASIQAYEELMTTCASYRQALLTMSMATAAFADAMETCSGLKGPSYETGTRLQAASGLHHLIGNHWHVLAETLDKKFEKPLRSHLDTYRTVVAERSANYERALKEKSQIIRDTEMRNMNKRERNMQSFREVLNVLQRQVDELDELKASHYSDIVEHEEEVWDVVQAKVCLVVRSSMDVFDRFTAKASDPVIEPMLQFVPDPFDSYGPPPAEDQIFSILPPLSIMTAPSSTPSPTIRNSDLESIDGLPSSSSRNGSWTAHSSNGRDPQASEWPESPTSTSPTTPRSFSPPSTLSRHSNHTLRKSDASKLRSVLAVEGEPPGDTNGATIKAPKTEKPSITSFTWTSSFPFGHSAYSSTEDLGETTPRRSSFPQIPTPPPKDKNESDDRFLSIPVTS
ncbi:hypothetical protein C8J56DRAFT_559196 [Mycena floridula]|nr:hypothetical protein C8J56DRAFT_559196 [Mycena floridula]